MVLSATLQKDIEDLILKPPYTVLVSLTSVMDDVTEDNDFSSDDLCETILSLIIHRNKLQEYFHVIIQQEVNEKKDPSTLFRQNSGTTKLLTKYSLQVGMDYLRLLLAPILRKISRLEVADYEVDKNRMEGLTESKVQENTERLITLCNTIIDCLLDHEEQFPTGMRMLCRELHCCVREKFPDAQYSCVGGLVFLRYICPAIISPDRFSLLPANGLQTKSRRIFVLCSKILQNISNNFVSEAKTGKMERMNSYITDTAPKFTQYFSRLSCEHGSLEGFEKESNEIRVTEKIERIVEYLKKHIHKLGVYIVSGKSSTRRDTGKAVTKSGYLHKHGENIVSEAWRKRYFVLRKGQLFYFKSSEDSHALGTIILSEIKEISFIDKVEFIFHLDSKFGRIYKLRASALLEMNDWIRKIEQSLSCGASGVANVKNIGKRMSVFSSASAVSKPDDIPLRRNIKSTFDKSSSVRWNKPESTFRSLEKKKGSVLLPQRSISASYTTKFLHHFNSELSSYEKGQESSSSTAVTQRERKAQFRASFLSSYRAPLISDQHPTQVCLEIKDEVPSPIWSSCIPVDKSSKRFHLPQRKDSPKRITYGRSSVDQIMNRNSLYQVVKGEEGGNAKNLPISGEYQGKKEEELEASEASERNVKGAEYQGEKEEGGEGEGEEGGGGSGSGGGGGGGAGAGEGEGSTGKYVAEYEGELKAWNEEKIKWEGVWGCLEKNYLVQYNSKEERKRIDDIFLLGATIFSSPPNFTISRGTYDFTCSAPTRSECEDWVNKLKELSVSNTKIISGLCKVQSISLGGEEQWSEVWVELSSSFLSTFTLGHKRNIPRGNAISIGDCSVHQPNGKALVLGIEADGKTPIFLLFDSQSHMKKWMTEIKQAKLNFWKEQDHSLFPTIERARQRTLSSLTSLDGILSPPPMKRFLDSIECGYLFLEKEKDKEAPLRLWFVLRGQTLYFYKSEYAEKLCGFIEIHDAIMRATVAVDEFSFALVGKTRILHLEASDIVSLRAWQRALYTARDLLSLVEFDKSSIRKKGIVTNFTFEDCAFLFVLTGNTLSWYHQDDTEQKNVVGFVSIENCTFAEFPLEATKEQNALQICNPKEKDLFLQAQSSEEKESWLQELKRAKLEYWRASTNAENFDMARGFLMKVMGKKLVRRWFVLHHMYLLCYKSPKDHYPESEFILTNATIVFSFQSTSNYGFFLEAGDQTLNLQASCLHSKEVWMKAIKEARSTKAQIIDTEPTFDKRYLALRIPDHEGYLMKQGGNIKNWKKRWFVLQFPCLFYFTSSQINPGEHCGVIPLQGSNIIVKKQNSAIHDVIQFQIETRSRIYYLQADTEECLDQWVQVIRNCLTNPVATPTTIPDQQIRKGHLQKRGVSKKSWKKRYFTLCGNILSYFRSDLETDPLGVIPLEGCTVTISEDSVKRKFSFVVSTRYRNYFLAASNEFEMAGWIQNLQYHSHLKDHPKEGAALTNNVEVFNRLNTLLISYEEDPQNCINKENS